MNPGEVFPRTSHTGPAWDLALEQIVQPRKAEAPWEKSREGMAVRDLFARFTYALDQNDLDAIMEFFTDDCVMTNPRGTFSGLGAVRAEFEKRHRPEDRRFHTWSNIVVRLTDEFLAGTITAYFLAVVQRGGEPARWVGGLRADKVVKRNGQWRIREYTTSVIFTAAVAPADA